jgi:hypothetical protein
VAKLKNLLIAKNASFIGEMRGYLMQLHNFSLRFVVA